MVAPSGATPPTGPLPPELLYRRCDPAGLGFETTAELPDLEEVVGQPRAVAAVEFGIDIRRPGYNIFALGPSGTGKHSMILDFLHRSAEARPAPDDWCYVHNFDEPHKPRALRLPNGRATKLRDDMAQLVDELRAAIPAAFESDDYRTRRELIENEYQERNQGDFAALQKEAQAHDIAIVPTQQGIGFAPMKDGEVIKPEDFNKLPEETRETYRKKVEDYQERLADIMRQAGSWEREARQRLRELNKDVTARAASDLIFALQDAYHDLPPVHAYLEDVRDDVVKSAFDFLRASVEQMTPVPGAEQAAGQKLKSLVSGTNELVGGDEPASFRRYHVNVIVHNRTDKGAPVVLEDPPTLTNLVGRIEHGQRLGALVTDFSFIKPGALHEANGGYLVVDARKILTQPFAYDALKRALTTREIRIESGQQLSGFNQIATLEPEAIPLDIKVVMVGDPMLYYLLAAQDPDFSQLFKVQAEFQDRMELTPENISLYARLIATLARGEKLCPLDAGAVARIIERGARLAGDNERLSTRFSFILDLLREADYWAGQERCKLITADHVERAIEAQIFRADRLREVMHEQITRETVLIDTDGAEVGQVNALSVLQVGTFAFGKPSRITARVRLGRGEVIDIERRVELGGPLHSKGVLILTGFLGGRFGEDRPLALSASLVFEQSYGGVDGDSASSTELYALLSALSGVPIKQGFAVTGSVNQAGEVQAIGGVNEKIEGFFDICQARGLTGEQGVMIPAANVKHLMLRDDVVEAVEAGRFRIVSVATVDEGIEVLTGVPAGARQDDSGWPEGTINGRVDARLAELAEAARRLGHGIDRDGGDRDGADRDGGADSGRA